METRKFDVVAFCPRCGSRLTRRHAFGRERPVCPACGLIHFRPTASAAVAVVVHEGGLLLVRRSIQPYRGLWGFPGGFQDHGESLEETAVRETEEETGLRVAVGRVLHVGHVRDDPRKLVNVVAFLARLDLPEGCSVADVLRASDDASDARFFGLQELPDQIAFENSQTVLRILRSQPPDGDLR